MTDLQERVEHLEWLLGYMMEMPETLEAALIDRGVRLTKYQHRLLAALARHPARALTEQGMMAALYHDRSVDDWPEYRTYSVFIYQINRKAEQAGLPTLIEGLRNVGGARLTPEGAEFVRALG